MDLVVNLDEFADLCGVSVVTMRAHLGDVDDDPGWLIERGARGLGYKIEAEGGLAWWTAKREDEDHASAERKAKLQQLRFELLGDATEGEEALSMSGRQRREEYAAAMEKIKLGRVMRELVEVAPLEEAMTSSVIELRRRLLLVPAEFAATTDASAADVQSLRGLLERAVNAFVDGLPSPGKRDDAP